MNKYKEKEVIDSLKEKATSFKQIKFLDSILELLENYNFPYYNNVLILINEWDILLNLKKELISNDHIVLIDIEVNEIKKLISYIIQKFKDNEFKTILEKIKYERENYL